ncbi:A1S_2505 family phage non-structural protein [Microbacterium sp.]|uniref:A1S_2505 family phage non-structural protein n=1 Tax=Microbacterium sp. TaxID=51671 RepID=UPI003C1F3EA1
MIDKLEANEVFVFGSNHAGHHRGGAARTAHQKFGAVWGAGHGLHGQSYAIDTMDGFEHLAAEVAKFLEFAAARRELTLLVTPVGTGIAGYSAGDVAPLFHSRPENVVLPDEFLLVLRESEQENDEVPFEPSASAPGYVDEFGKEVVAGLLLGGRFDGAVCGVPILSANGVPDRVGVPVDSTEPDGPQAWYELRTPMPIAGRFIYEFQRLQTQDGHDRGTHLSILSEGAHIRTRLHPELYDGSAVANIREQLEWIGSASVAERRDFHDEVVVRAQIQDLWNLDDPRRTEARILQELSWAIREGPQGQWRDEDSLAVLLARARYAQGLLLPDFTTDMGCDWWRIQLAHLGSAREAELHEDVDGVISSLATVVSAPTNAGADYDYELEGLVKLALLESKEIVELPPPSGWAQLALDFASRIPGWRPGAWFSDELRDRLTSVANGAP